MAKKHTNKLSKWEETITTKLVIYKNMNTSQSITN